MKTWEEFCDERENSHKRHLRPGAPGFNACSAYLCFLFHDGKYTFIEGPETLSGDVDLATAAQSICDFLERFPDSNYDLNFSDGFPKSEKEVLSLVAMLASEKEHFRSLAGLLNRDVSDMNVAANRIEQRANILSGELYKRNMERNDLESERSRESCTGHNCDSCSHPK